MKTLRIVLLVILVLLVFPLVSWIVWLSKPSHPLNVLIVDKSVMDARRTKHLALVWDLNHHKFKHGDNKPYSLEQDYYGFLPLKPYKGKNYEARRIMLTDVNNLASANDILYYADTYGVFFNEWFMGVKQESGTSRIIGGLNQNDFLLMAKMAESGKTIVAEHDFFSITTEPLVLKKTEELFHLHYTGWNGRYFTNLDSVGHQVPHWIIDAYRKMNGGQWPFTGKGMILTRGPSQVVVLQEGKELKASLPMIVTEPSMVQKTGLPDSIPFINWFDITLSDSLNESIASLKLPVNEDGVSVLEKEGIPPSFTIIWHYKAGYEFWYLGGDFSEARMPYWTYKLRGWEHFRFIHASRPGTQKYFVWNYYMPLIEHIFANIPRSGKQQ